MMKLPRQIPTSHSNILWAGCAIGLGVWESAAVLSKKRVPTITMTCQKARSKRKRETEAVIIVWLFGLGWHLLRYQNQD